jgi:hypothetical protein
MVKKGKKEKFTLYIDKELRDKYKAMCQNKGHIPSRMIEIFIEKELKKAEDENEE